MFRPRITLVKRMLNVTWIRRSPGLRVQEGWMSTALATHLRWKPKRRSNFNVIHRGLTCSHKMKQRRNHVFIYWPGAKFKCKKARNRTWVRAAWVLGLQRPGVTSRKSANTELLFEFFLIPVTYLTI